MFGVFRISRRDVSSNAFVEPVTGEDAERRGQLLLAVQTLFFDGLVTVGQWFKVQNLVPLGRGLLAGLRHVVMPFCVMGAIAI